MKIKLSITRHTTESELIHLGNFFTALGLNRGAHVFAPPTDPAELDEGDVTVVAVGPEQEAAIDAATGITPKRRRRTKAEIEAEAHASQGAPLPPVEPVTSTTLTPEEVVQADKDHPVVPVGNDDPAPTPPVIETTVAPEEAPATTTPVQESPSEPPTPVSLNIKATAVAKKIGPEKIKAKIIELGGKLISTLSPEALVEFDAWLDAQ